MIEELDSINFYPEEMKVDLINQPDIQPIICCGREVQGGYCRHCGQEFKMKFVVLGNHPVLKYVNKYCHTKEEAESEKTSLEKIGYEVEIKPL